MDGIEVIVPKSELDYYFETLDATIKLFNIQLEHELYDFITYKNVNNYIAKVNNGGIKQKGLFVENPVLGNSTDTLVIAKALKAYYIDNINPIEFISNPDKYGLHIYDYCKSNKIGKSFTVVWNDEVQQQLNRYYFKKNAGYLFKVKPDPNYSHKSIDDIVNEVLMANPSGMSRDEALKVAKKLRVRGSYQHVNVGEGVQIFNEYYDATWEEYGVNYAYYIKECMSIIDTINNNNQLTLF